MRRFILFFIITFYSATLVLPADRLLAQEKTISPAQAAARFTEPTRPIDIFKSTAKRAFETLKGMIFKGDEGGQIAQKRDEILGEKAQEQKAASVAEGSSR